MQGGERTEGWTHRGKAKQGGWEREEKLETNSKRSRALKDVPPTQNPNSHLFGPEKDLVGQSPSYQQNEREGRKVWGHILGSGAHGTEGTNHKCN